MPTLVQTFRSMAPQPDQAQPIADDTLSRGFVPLTPTLRVIVPEWRSLSAKLNSGNIAPHELDRLDKLNQMIKSEAAKVAN